MIVGGWDGLSLDIWVTPTNLGVFGSFLSVVSEYLTKQLKEERVYFGFSSRRTEFIIAGKACPSGRSRKLADHIFIHRQEAKKESRKWGESINPQAHFQ